MNGIYGIKGRWLSGQKHQTVNLTVYAYVGSNPALPIIYKMKSYIKLSFNAGVAQLARASAFQAEGRGFESRLPLVNSAHVAQSVEHILGKDEVVGSNPIVGSH